MLRRCCACYLYRCVNGKFFCGWKGSSSRVLVVNRSSLCTNQLYGVMINIDAKWTGMVQYMLHCTTRFFKDPNTFLHTWRKKEFRCVKDRLNVMMSVWPIRPKCLTQPLCLCPYDFVKDMFIILLLRISLFPSAQTRALSAYSVAVSHRSTRMHLHRSLKEPVNSDTQAAAEPVLIGNNPQ